MSHPLDVPPDVIADLDQMYAAASQDVTRLTAEMRSEVAQHGRVAAVAILAGILLDGDLTVEHIAALAAFAVAALAEVTPDA